MMQLSREGGRQSSRAPATCLVHADLCQFLIISQERLLCFNLGSGWNHRVALPKQVPWEAPNTCLWI